MFSYEFCEIFKNTFFTEHLWTTALCTPSLELRCQTKNLRVFWERLNRSSIAKMVVELLKLWSYYVLVFFHQIFLLSQLKRKVIIVLLQ